MITQAQAAIPKFAFLFLSVSDEMMTLIPMVGILLITVGLFMMIRKRKQRAGQEPTAREQLERSRQKQRMRGDLEQLMVELEQLTKRFSAQLDAKSLHLEKLIDQADRRIEELNRLQGEGESQSTTSQRQANDDPWSASASSTAASTRTSSGASANTAARVADASVAGSTHDADLTHSVYELADQGFDAVDIARKLDEHVGKVELMLALRKA